MNEEDYKKIQEIKKELKNILDKVNIEEDNWTPLNSAVSVLRFVEAEEGNDES